MVTNYEILTNLKNQNNLFILATKGIVSSNIILWYDVYEKYQIQISKEKKSVAITFLSEKYKICEKTIYNIIKFMET